MNFFKRKPKDPFKGLSAEQIKEKAEAFGMIPGSSDVPTERIAELEANLNWPVLAPGVGKGRRGYLSRLIVDNPFGKDWKTPLESGDFASLKTELAKPYEQLIAEALGMELPLTENDLEYVAATVRTILTGRKEKP